MPPRSRSLRWLLVGAGLLLVYTLVGFLLLPRVVHSQLEQRGTAALGRTLTVGHVALNPYTLSCTLENLQVAGLPGERPLLTWRRFHGNFEAWASLRGSWVLDELSLEGLDARLRRLQDGRLDVADVIARLQSEPAPEPQEPRPIQIRRLRVDDARFEFADDSRPQPFETTLGPLTFSLTEFHTAGQRGAPYEFEATSEAGERFRWSGTLQADPLRSAGKLSLENLPLAKYAPYHGEFLQAEVTAGTLSVEGRYELDLSTGVPDVKFLEGALRLRGLAVIEHTSRAPVLDLVAADVIGVDADLQQLQLKAARVDVSGAHLRVRREKDGSLNLTTLLPPPNSTSATAPSSPPPEPAPKPTAEIGELLVQETRVDVVDHSPPRTAELSLQGMRIVLRDLTLAPGARMPLEFAAAWAGGGQLSGQGTVALDPLGIEMQVNLQELALAPLSPYLEAQLDARLTSGMVGTTLQASADLAGETPQVKVSGEVNLGNLAIVDSEGEDLLGFHALTLRGIAAESGTRTSLAIDEVALAAPYGRVIRQPDQSLNVATVLARETDAPVENAPTVRAPESSAPAPSPEISIGRVTIADGVFRFVDRAIEPSVTLAVSEFGGALTGLSSTGDRPAQVELQARVDGSGPLRVVGGVDALRQTKAAQLELDLRNVDLLPFSPYSARYAGFELARGKLMLDVKFALADQKLDAANVLTLQQFTFGQPVASPDATQLPVRLGVALLKDGEGNIVLDVPVQGSLDDPEFRVGRVVRRVIVNLLTKAATSPFALLGAAFGGGGEELSFQEFDPGSGALLERERAKLNTLVTALQNRPGLNLQLEGAFAVETDRAALQRLRVERQIRRAVLERRGATAGSPGGASGADAIAPAEFEDVLRHAYLAAFPPEAPAVAAAPSAPPSEPPAPRRGLLRRALDVITLRGPEPARAAAAPEPAPAAPAPELPPPEEMLTQLAGTIEITDEDLRGLGQARAAAVRDFLVQTGGIAPERLFLARDQSGTAEKTGARVFLTLQ